MKLLFIDETEKFGHYGLSVVCVDHSKYNKIGLSIINALNTNGWSMDKEFKSTCIFSSTEGCPNISIETRKKIAKEIIQSNISGDNSRLTAYFAYTLGQKNIENHTKLLNKIITKLPKASTSRNGKNLMGIYHDELDIGRTTYSQINSTLMKVHEREYQIIEQPFFVQSSNSTYGILLSDHIAFIALWKSLNEQAKNQETGEIKRLKNEFIHELFNDIRKIKIIKVN
jgi:hypothetical protein